MKTLILLLFVLGYSVSNAQITLEKKFDGSQMNVINLSATYYFSTDNSKSQISVYKENFSLHKTVTFTLPTNYSFGYATFSDKVFNSSTDLEFLVLVNKINGVATDADASKLLLYNESGQIIFDFGTGTSISSFFFKTTSGTTKMIVYKMIFDLANFNFSTNTEIYSLIGNYTGISAVKNTNELSVSVNSQNKTIEFDAIQKAEKYNLRLYDIRGNEIIHKNFKELIDGKIAVSTESLTSGIYIYSLNACAGKVIIK